MQQVLVTVFSKPIYVLLAGAIFVALFIGLSIVSEYLFLEPMLVMQVTQSSLLGFLLIIVISALSGIVVSANVFRIRTLRKSAKNMTRGILGSIIGASAGACSCGSIGFAVISTFGAVGGIATSFLTNYELPLRIASIAILGYTLYTSTKALSIECKIKS